MPSVPAPVDADGRVWETPATVTRSPRIRTAIIMAIVVVVLSGVLLFGLSVIGQVQPDEKSPATAAPILFPTTVQQR